MDEKSFRVPLYHRAARVIIILAAWWSFEPIFSLVNQRPIDPQKWLFYGLAATTLVILTFVFQPLIIKRPALGLPLVLGVGFAAILGITAVLMRVFGR